MKKKNIVLILIIAAILIGIITFVIIQNSKNESRKYSIEKVENFDYFVIQDNDKYGVIDKNAKIIIEPKFQNVIIPNPSKAVFLCTPAESQPKAFNEKNEELFTGYEEVASIRLKNLASNLMYEKSVLKYKKDGKYGLIDYTGKEITKPLYGSIDSLEYKEGELIVEQGGKYGVININGVTLVEPEYENIRVDGFYSEENGYKNAGYIVGTKTEEGYRYGYIDVKGNKILENEFNEINRVTNFNDDNNIYFIAAKNGQYGLFKNNKAILNNEYQSIDYNKTNNIFIIEKSRKFGFTDAEGKVLTDIKYSQIDVTGKYIYAKEKQGETTVLDAKGNKVEIDSNVSKLPVADEKYNIVMTVKEDKTLYGVEDKNGTEIIPSIYTYIEYLFDNYFTVCNENGLLGVLDDKNNVKIEVKYNTIQPIQNNKLVQTAVTEGNVVSIFDNTMTKVCEIKNPSMLQIGEFLKVKNDNESYYFNKEGKVVTNKDVYPNNKLYAKQENGKWGFVDSSDTVKIDFKYDKVTEFNEFGFAGIMQNGKWGVVDTQANIIQEPKYELKDNVEPSFLGKYYKVTYGFGELYFTNK